VGSFEGKVIAGALNTPDKAIIDANNVGLTIFLVIFFLVKLSRILPLFFKVLT
jgi:hypothetical protein